MTGLGNLVRRNTKLFFKDHGMLISSLITPIIMLVLYATFLANVYHNSFVSSLDGAIEVSEKLIDATVGGELFSSLLAVSCVTVSFCCNMIMVRDKVTGARRDLTVTPVKRSTMALSYYLSTLFSTIVVSLIAMCACLLYLANTGWYLSVTDILLIVLDVFLLTMFGTALSSIINSFLTTEGQIAAVSTTVSAGYGFICGAYMPISQFGSGLQKVLSFLPGTYGTSLIRNHAMRGVFAEMRRTGFPAEVVEAIRDSIDCNLYFFGTKVTNGMMLLVMCVTVAVLVALYVLIHLLKKEI